jgi:hypothetical protein
MLEQGGHKKCLLDANTRAILDELAECVGDEWASIAERGKKESDYQLLNNDALAKLDANKKASVFVEIIAVDSERLYTIHREVEYMRVYPKFIAKESYKTLKMFISDIDSPDIRREVEPGPNYNKINELINELFPKNLSHYFLFDGERWRMRSRIWRYSGGSY